MTAGGLWRVKGRLFAADGTAGPVEYWGDLDTARTVLYATCEGARDRGDGFEVWLYRPDGTAALTWSGVIRDVEGPAFEVVGEVFVNSGGPGAIVAPGSDVIGAGS